MQLLYNIERLTLNNLFAEYKIEKKEIARSTDSLTLGYLYIVLIRKTFMLMITFYNI